MDIVSDSVNKLEEITRHSGCEDGSVHLEVNPDVKFCRYERGACMTATFGGRSAEFITDDPIRAMTKISFMFGAPLDTPATRGAACAIINVGTGFFCLSRVLHSCPQSAHGPCREQLINELAAKKVCCIGTIPDIEAELEGCVTTEPGAADVILINGEGMIKEGTGDIVESYKEAKHILCLGPSTSGIARLQHLEHWCPFGT
ncbi:MAG: hypothetical protein WC391_00025 [Methanoregula sp.]|jgi:hypothetical protein